MRNTVIAGWFSAIMAFVFMIIGHAGDHDLSWLRNQISTYAAQAPHDTWITASMLLSCLALLSVSILVSRYKIIGDHYIVHIIPVIIGAIISGLLVLAYYEETARTATMLKSSGFMAIRVQSFHDAGLLVFFSGLVMLVLILGSLVIAFKERVRDKFIGLGIFLLGPASFFLMSTAWPKVLGFIGPSAGIRQRASLLCLWLAMVMVLALASNQALRAKAHRNSAADS